MAFYDHPNPNVRVKAAKATLAIAPAAARHVLETVAATCYGPEILEAGMSLTNLDCGIYKPTWSVHLSIGFRTVKGSIDPRSRVRRLLAVELWEISIVTFPLLAGARGRAVKHSNPPPKSSFARTRAERDWAAMFGAASTVDLPASLTRRRQPVISRPGRIKAWRQA
jgi:hypothetical protein